MTIEELSHYLDKLENTSSRIEITKILAQLFGKLDSQEIDKAVYMVLGTLAPPYKNVVLNVADKMLERAIFKAYDVSIDEVRAKYKLLGDLGMVAESYAQGKSSLSINTLYDKLVQIANFSGEGSTEKKIDNLAAILQSLDPLSARFIARIPVGKLRLGFSDKTVLDAISWMEVGDKSMSKKLEQAYQVLPDVGKLAQKVREVGIKKASLEIAPQHGTPVIPMLPQRLKTTEEMVNKMGRVAVEPKFDGLRVQIHYKKGEPIYAYTRNLNEISQMFPELSEIGKHLSANSAILDSEAIGLNFETGKYVDFQTTMQRRRKHDISDSAKNIPLKFQIFDVLYARGENTMNLDYETRRSILEKLIKPNDTFVLDQVIITEDPAEIRNKHHELTSKGLEGVIVKNIKSRYVPGRTGFRWVKMKEAQDTKGKLADTVDAVIMGYTRGRGKRASFGVGQFLAGVINGEYVLSITKVGTGMSDLQLKQLNEKLQSLIMKTPPKEYLVHKDLEPDFWVAPEVVVELAADEVTKSPKHTAGFALRFPRLLKIREDKSISQATTLMEINKLYAIQKKF